MIRWICPVLGQILSSAVSVCIGLAFGPVGMSLYAMGCALVFLVVLAVYARYGID